MKLLAGAGSFVGSSVGWWLGAHVGTTTAVMLSGVGAGVGFWGGRRLADRLLD